MKWSVRKCDDAHGYLDVAARQMKTVLPGEINRRAN